MRTSLLKSGVPFDKLFPDIDALHDYECMAFEIAIGEVCEGQSFDWDNMRWRPQK